MKDLKDYSQFETKSCNKVLKFKIQIKIEILVYKIIDYHKVHKEIQFKMFKKTFK